MSIKSTISLMMSCDTTEAISHSQPVLDVPSVVCLAPPPMRTSFSPLLPTLFGLHRYGMRMSEKKRERGVTCDCLMKANARLLVVCVKERGLA